MSEKQIKHKGVILSDKEVNQLLNEQDKRIKELETEKELLKKDGNNLIQLLENQSLIICELHSKLMEYQLKEPIVLTKEDLELMGEAVSYYTHGRCPE